MAVDVVWDLPTVIKRFSGAVDALEFVRSIERIAADDGFRLVRFIVNDFSDADSLTLDDSAIDDIAAVRIASSFANDAVQVLVVDPSGVCDALMAATARRPLRGTAQTLRMRSLSEARAWIDGAGDGRPLPPAVSPF